MNNKINILATKNVTKTVGWSITIAPWSNKHTEVGYKKTATAIRFSNVLYLHWYQCTYALSSFESSFHECYHTELEYQEAIFLSWMVWG